MRNKIKGRATLGDIAKAAGVSRATVSRALRNNPVISEAVRKRVQKLAGRMGYRPDPEAARLMGYLKKSKATRFESVIGILNEFANVDDLRQDPYTSALLDGVIGRAGELGYAVDFLGLGQTGMSPRRIDQIIAARGIRGVLVPPEPKPLFDAGLNWQRIAAVATTTTAQPLRMHRVLPHNFHNTGLILDALLDRCYDRIGLIYWPPLEKRQMSAATAIYALYAMIEKRIAPLVPFEWRWEEEQASRLKRMAVWFAEARPEVVLGFGRFILDTLKEATGLAVPGEVGYVSYGDCAPDMAHLNQNPDKVGSAAVDLLSAHIQRGDIGIPEGPKTTLIEGVFVPGPTLREKK